MSRYCLPTLFGRLRRLWLAARARKIAQHQGLARSSSAKNGDLAKNGENGRKRPTLAAGARQELLDREVAPGTVAGVAMEADMTAGVGQHRQEPLIVAPLDLAIVLDRDPRIVTGSQHHGRHADLGHERQRRAQPVIVLRAVEAV